MKLSGECANFEVDTGSVISTVAYNNTDMTYILNVDMRQVLGDLYHKYDKFIIVFNGISMWSSATGYTTSTVTTGITAGTVWTLGMTGLNWVNNSFNGNINTIGYFPNRFTMPLGNAYASTNATSNNGICFRKPDNPFVSLSISPYLTRQGGIALATGTLNTGWDINYSFSIFGLTE